MALADILTDKTGFQNIWQTLKKLVDIFKFVFIGLRMHLGWHSPFNCRCLIFIILWENLTHIQTPREDWTYFWCKKCLLTPFSPTSSSSTLEYFHKLIVMVSQGLSFWNYHYFKLKRFQCDLVSHNKFWLATWKLHPPHQPHSWISTNGCNKLKPTLRDQSGHHSNKPPEVDRQ